SDDDVLLESLELVLRTADSGGDEYPGRVLERCGREEALPRERYLGDAHDNRLGLGWCLACLLHLVVLCRYVICVSNITYREPGVSGVLDPHPREHLLHDYLDVLSRHRLALKL